MDFEVASETGGTRPQDLQAEMLAPIHKRSVRIKAASVVLDG